MELSVLLQPLFLLFNMAAGTATLMTSIRRTENGTRTKSAIRSSEDGIAGEDGSGGRAGNW